MGDAPFFDPYAKTHVTASNLPHWRQDGVLYFVTFRLSDSLPLEKLHGLDLERKAWLRSHQHPLSIEDEQEYWRRFGGRMEEFLEAGHGECLLAKPNVKRIVEKTFRHFDGERYELGSFAVASNHAHVLVRPLSGHELSAILFSWKSYSATRINRLLGRTGPLWQKESHDHIVRNASALWHIERYIAAHKK